MVEVVAEDDVVAVEVFFRCEGETETVEVVDVFGVREVWRGLGGVFGEAAVVLDSYAEAGGEVVGGDARGLLGVDGERRLVLVVGAGGDGEDVLVGHGGRCLGVVVW